jgi:hypothetical protein
MIKTFFNVNTISLLVSEGYYDSGSIDGFLQELDREKAKDFLITKGIKEDPIEVR